MKMNIAPVNLETSAGLERKVFSIGDAGLLFDILRSKMYSNPILAICREYVCNAIDSHREAGKSDEPVQICLPNILEPHFKVRDFGVGISPDRMENIFIKYGSSTKREDNVQIGSYGLGAKCAFSMVDSFAVNTIYNGISYKYACVIDETKVGKLFLLSKSHTKEGNGTEVIIPVQSKDFAAFNTWTEHVGRHWTIKPIIKGGSIIWQTPKVILQGKDWAIASHGDHWSKQSKAIIDGIEYPLELDTLRTYANTKIIDACRGQILMYFATGELTLSSSREQIYLDKQTKDKISDRLVEMQKEIKSLLLAKIAAFPNLWQANVYFRKELATVFSDLSFLGKLEWKGIVLHSSGIPVFCPAFSFTRGRYSRKNGNDPTKLTRSRATNIVFQENCQLFINDLTIQEPTPRHVKKAFEDDPTLNCIQILCPTATVPETNLNKTLHLDKMAPRRLSEITKASGRAYTAPSARLLVFKFDSLGCQQFRQVSYASIEEDNNSKVLCLLEKVGYPVENRLPLSDKGFTIPLLQMKSIALKSPNVSFYGVDGDLPKERIKEEFGDFEELNKYIDTKILNNKAINYVEIKFANQCYHLVDDEILNNLPKLIKLIKDPNSPFLVRTVLHQKIKDISEGDTGLLNIYETIKGDITKTQTAQYLKDNPNFNIELFNKEYEKTYPLLKSVNDYHWGKIVEHVAQYVNLIDTNNKDQKKTN